MNPLLKLFLCASLAATNVGCDTIGGIHRSVSVQRLPSPTVVTAALASVPGITSVERRTVEASTAWSLPDGIIHNPPYDQFFYRADPLFGVVKAQQSEDGTKSIELYSVWMNHTPPQKVFEDSRSLMDAVYASLRRHSPDLPPAAKVKETLDFYPKQ